MFLYQKYKYDYKHIDISNKREAIIELSDFIKLAIEEQPIYFSYDTEDDGLNIITAKPFLVSMGFNKHVITFDYDAEIMNAFWKMFLLPNENGKTIQGNENYIGLFAHNAKFDYHMMINGGSMIPEEIKILDSITIARLTEYADDKARMGLEYLGAKYIDDTSKFAGHVIKEVIKKENKKRRDALRNKIMKEFPDDGFSKTTKTGKNKSTGKLTDLIKEYDKKYTKFVNDDDKYFKFIHDNYTEPNYKDAYSLEPELMRSYAADDIVIMSEYISKAIPTLYNVDKNLVVTKREGELIRAVASMERTGIKIDVNYVLECRKKIVYYQSLLYFELNILSGYEFTVGQHDFIKKMLKSKYNIVTDKDDEDALTYIREHTDNEELKEICSIIMELRTLDKWLSTYVDGKLNAIVDGRIYTDINNSGAVSGRVSCDMQQQPKEAVFDRDGNELFHPRRMFVCDDGYCLAFCDESQMELRVQAYYTIIHANEPDLAMCRAYMPYKCYRITELGAKRMFDYNSVDDLKKFGKFTWYTIEDNNEWSPTDLHSETTKHAFPDVPETDPHFKKLRKMGKRANFLKVYQGGVDALQDSLKIDRTTAEALDKAFYKAFPRIKDYQNWVVEHLKAYGYVENLYGRRYYMNDSRLFYRGCNYLIQGTCADMVKVFEINVWKYLKKNNLKSKMVLPIHDELMLLVHKDEMFVIEEVKRIMEDVTDVIKNIPMISEPEVSYTNWAEKVEYEV